jgi:hypothetical protein
MHGMGSTCTVAGSARNALAVNPNRRAATSMLAALLPSRDTPQATRSCSRGIHTLCASVQVLPLKCLQPLIAQGAAMRKSSVGFAGPESARSFSVRRLC